MAELPDPLHHTVLAIYKAYEKRAGYFGDGRGVPMSNVANECERSIWYQLRWANQPEQISGQLQSIFDTGIAWEERLLDDLELIGCQVDRVDPATGQQFRVELADGWLRGKLDGQVAWLARSTKDLACRGMQEPRIKKFQRASKEKTQRRQAGSLRAMSVVFTRAKPDAVSVLCGMQGHGRTLH